MDEKGAAAFRSKAGQAQLTFGTPPAAGVEIPADFEFNVPARFEPNR